MIFTCLYLIYITTITRGKKTMMKEKMKYKTIRCNTTSGFDALVNDFASEHDVRFTQFSTAVTTIKGEQVLELCMVMIYVEQEAPKKKQMVMV